MDTTDHSKLVRKHFLQEMAAKLPQFEPQGGKGKISLSGWRSFIWTVADDLHFFIGLGVDALGEMFTVEGAWNATPDYPANESPLLLLQLDQEDLDQRHLVFRLGVKDQTGAPIEKPWWETHSAKEEDIEKLAAGAVQAVQRDFLPIFTRRAARKGIQLGR